MQNVNVANYLSYNKQKGLPYELNSKAKSYSHCFDKALR